MTFLRRILIFFGWAIPFTVAGLTAVNLYVSFRYGQMGTDGNSPFALKAISILARSVGDLAISPLCFFGAYVLKERSVK